MKIIYFRNYLLISSVIYAAGVILSSVIMLILNVKSGHMIFRQHVEGWAVILQHNLKIDLLMVLGGVLFSFPTIAILFINGWNLGFYLSQSIVLGQTSQLVNAILPHAFFELPGTIIGASLGLSMTHLIILRIFNRTQIPLSSLRLPTYLGLMTILTIIGAVIEGR